MPELARRAEDLGGDVVHRSECRPERTPVRAIGMCHCQADAEVFRRSAARPAAEARSRSLREMTVGVADMCHLQFPDTPPRHPVTHA